MAGPERSALRADLRSVVKGAGEVVGAVGESLAASDGDSTASAIGAEAAGPEAVLEVAPVDVDIALDAVTTICCEVASAEVNIGLNGIW